MMINSKKTLILLGVACIALIGWRINRIVNTPNLLLNSGFEADGLSGWQIVNQSGAQAASISSPNDSPKSVLQLNIAGSVEGNWTGAGQRVSVEPNQRYGISINYQLVDNTQSLSNILLRLSQFDQAGELINSDEVSPPGPLVASTSDSGGEQPWLILRHNIVTDNEAVAVEVGVGLFGNEATTVQIDNIVFKASPTWPEAIRQDSILLFLSILLVGWIGYYSYPVFTPLFIKIAVGISTKRRIVTIGVVNVLLFFLFAELLALGFYFVRDGKLFYTNKTRYELIEEDDTSEELTPKRIHPFFGYVDRPGWQRGDDDVWQDAALELRTINNHGLGSPYDYPYAKSNPDQYIIGIFGGSVAERFALLAGEDLIESLQEDDFFGQKDIVVLNFAKGGYKQPQQLLILSYFLSLGQKFDMVINIDGFNEVAFGHRNYQRHIDVSMPHINIMDGLINLSDQTTLTPEKLESLTKINQYKTKLNGLAETINKTKVASLNFVLEQYYLIVSSDFEEELNRFNELDSNLANTSLLFVKPNETPMEDTVLFGNIADTWATSSIMMSRMVSGSNVAYYHFLQPNQYYSNKIFSEEEAERALESEHPYYSTLVGIGYPALIEKFDILAENKVNFYNGIPIFDNESEMVYIDNCCHYNKLGNEILADYIAASILGSAEFKEIVALNKKRQ